MENLNPAKLLLTKHCPQFGRTVIFSALSRYLSLVICLTDSNAPAHFATLLVRRLTFGLISNFVFLYCISTGRTQHQIPKLRQCSRCAKFNQQLLFMASEKHFKLKANQIIQLITPMGACIATDKITVEGELVDYMVREEPNNDIDSGWQFFSGTEDQEYVDNAENLAFYDVNTIANYDQAIIPYLDLPFGTQLERVRGTDKFQIILDKI
jgi:hypothetical protein